MKIKTAISAALCLCAAVAGRAEYLNLTPSSGGLRDVLGDPVDWTDKFYANGRLHTFGNMAQGVPLLDAAAQLADAQIASASAWNAKLSSLTVGNLSPIFTASVTAGTAPAVTFTLSNASANTFLAGPTSGAAAAPSYRAIVANDIPGTLNATAFGGSGVTSTYFNNVAITAPASPATFTLGSGKTFVVPNSGTLDLAGFTVTAASSGTVVMTTRNVSAGTGLSGGGGLGSDVTLSLPNVGTSGAKTLSTGETITTDAQGRVSAMSVTTRTLSVSGLGFGGGGTLAADRTFTLTSSSNPGAAASILATNAAGQLTLVDLLANTTTFNLVNATATTVNFAGAATTVNVGASAGTLNLNSGTVSFTGTLLTPATAYTTDIGQLTKKFRALHASELWVETLVAQSTAATIGGRVLVGKTTSLIADASAAATTIDVKHNSLVSGDRLYLESSGKTEFMAVTSGPTTITGGYRYSVTRNLDGSGADQWYTGDAAFDTGSTGAGWIDLYSINGIKGSSEAGPTIAGNVRNSSTFNDWSTRWAIGNLKGLYGFGADTYGAGFGRYATANETWITVETSLGYRLGNNASVQFSLNPSGTLMLGSDISAPATTSIVIPSAFITYNGGALAPGDVLLGDNTSGVSNVRFNRANNRWEWRSGNTVKGYIDSTAAFNINDGQTVLGPSIGLYFDNAVGGGSGNVIQFIQSGYGLSSIVGHKLGTDLWETSSQSSHTAATGYADNVLSSVDNSGNASYFRLRAVGSASSQHAGKSSAIFYGLTAGVFEGLVVGSVNWPNHIGDFYGVGWFQDGVALRDTTGFDVLIVATSSPVLSGNRTLTVDVGNAARTLKLTGNTTLDDWFNQSVKTTASPTFALVTATTGVNSGSGFMTGYHDTFKVATNEQLHIRGHLNLADGVLMVVVNDADTANKGLELRGSAFLMSGGNLTIGTGGTGATVSKLVLNGGSGTAGGGELDFQANSVTGVAIGTENSIAGTGSNTKATLYSSNSTYRLYGVGSGAANFDASGNLTSASDERKKDIIGRFVRGLDDLSGIQPISFKWKESTGLDRTETYSGFSAQNVLPNVPEAVGMAPDGSYTLDDRTLLAAAINAINELSERVSRLDGKQPETRQSGADARRIAELVKNLDARRKVDDGRRARPSPSPTAAANPTPTPKKK